MSYCIKCGAHNQDGALFCNHCGAKIEEAYFDTNNQVLDERTEEIPDDASQDDLNFINDTSRQGVYHNTNNQNNQENTSGKKSLLWVVSIVLAIIGGLSAVHGCLVTIKFATIIAGGVIDVLAFALAMIAHSNNKEKKPPVIGIVLSIAMGAVVGISAYILYPVKPMAATSKNTDPSGVSYYSYRTHLDVSFPVPEEFMEYGKMFCATPDDDYVSLFFAEKNYLNEWTAVADKYAYSVISMCVPKFVLEYRKISIGGYEGRLYECYYSSKGQSNGLVRVACLNNPDQKKILCMVMNQDPDKLLENDYDTAYMNILINAKRNGIIENDLGYDTENTINNQSGTKPESENETNNTSREEEEKKAKFKFGGLTFSIPTKYEKYTDVEFRTRDGNAGFYFESSDTEVSARDFRSKSDQLDNLIDETVHKNFSYEDMSAPDAFDIEVAGFSAREYRITGRYENKDAVILLTLINNDKSKKLVFVIGAGEKNSSLETDYKEMIESVSYKKKDKAEVNESSASNKTDSKTSDEVDSNLKAFLDQYESFVDKYVSFMKKYYSNPTDLSLLSEYYDIMEEYEEFAERIDQYDSDDMSLADAEYYLEVTTRCTQKMLNVLDY